MSLNLALGEFALVGVVAMLWAGLRLRRGNAGLVPKLVIAAVLGGAAFFAAYDPRSEKERAAAAIAQAKAAEEFDRRTMLTTTCQAVVLSALKAPSTAKFSDATTDFAEYNEKTGAIRAQGRVDSQNGFGAMLRSRFECRGKMTPRGTPSWRVLMLDGTEIRLR